MSIPKKDFRLALTPEIDSALCAESRALGCDKQEIAREVLRVWAEKRLHAARMHVGYAIANGTIPASAGVAAADDGTRRHASRGGSR